MFSKSKAPATKTVSTAVTAAKKQAPSVISSDMSILGNLHSDGVIDIDGRIEGNVRGSNVTIRKNGKVQGDVVAESVHVYGEVKGLIKARMVNLYASCHVEGVIMHESLSIEDGAFVDGKFKRTDKIFSDEEENGNSNTSPSFSEYEEPKDEVNVLENIRLIS